MERYCSKGQSPQRAVAPTEEEEEEEEEEEGGGEEEEEKKKKKKKKKKDDDVRALISLFHTKNRLVHTLIINATLLTQCHSGMFHLPKGHLQGLRLLHLNSKNNKINYQLSERCSLC
jgi:hypothetical protein